MPSPTRIGRHLGALEQPFDRAIEQLHDHLVVIDEIDRLAGSESSSVLNALVNRLPSDSSVAMGTRRLDVLPDLERWRVGGDLSCVSSHDLRFRLWEVERLFREVYRVDLSVDELHRVSSASGGWPVALHYFAVTLRREPIVDRSSLIDRLGRSNLHLRRYLRTQVLAGLPDRHRSELRRLAVLDRIDDERARLFAPGLAGGLADLVSTGVLAENPVDGTYRMHSLLRAELLDELAAERSDVSVRDLYLEAAQVLERVGETHEACLARARAGHLPHDHPPVDPVVLHAAASRSLYAGDVVTARGRLETAVALFAEEGGSVQALRQLRLVNDWSRPAPGAPTSWVAAIHLAVTGRRMIWKGEHADLVEAIRRFVVGDDDAHEAFLTAAAGTTNTTVSQLAGLGAGLTALLAGRPEEATSFGQLAWSLCRDDGSDALALVSEALMLAATGTAEEIETITRLGATREDSVLRAMLHLVATQGRAVPGERRVAHRDLAVSLLRGAGFEALANRCQCVVTRDDVENPPDAALPVRDRMWLSCLGGFEIRVDGHPLGLGALRPIHREVLGLLASTPDVPVHRDEIAEAIWPDRSAGTSRAGLHTAVSAIRSWLVSAGDPLGRERIERISDAYRICIDPTSTDLGLLVDRTRSARRRLRSKGCSVEEIREIVDLYTDEPFRSFGPVEWAVQVRRSTAAEIHDLLLAAQRASSDDDVTWRSLSERFASVGRSAEAPADHSAFHRIG